MVFRSRTAKIVVTLCVLTVARSAFAITIAEVNSADGLSVEEKRSCAVQMCGAPNPPTVLSKELQTSYAQYFEAGFKKSLESILELNLQQTKLLLEIEAQAPQLEKVQLSGIGTSVANFVWGLHQAQHISDYLSQSAGTTISVRPGYESQLPHLSVSDQKLLKLILEDFFALPDVVQSTLFERSGFTNTIRKIYAKRLATEPIQQLKIEFAKTTLAKIERLKQLWPEFPMRKPRVLKTILQGKEPSLAQVKELASNLSTLALVDIIQDRKGIYKSRKPNVSELMVSVISSVEYQNLKAQVNLSEWSKADALNHCRESVAQTLLVNITEKDFAPAKKISDEVRTSAIEVVKRMFKGDPQTISNLTKVLSEVTVGFPKTRDQQVAYFREVLESELLELTNSLRDLKKASPELKIIYFLLSKPSEDEELFSDTKKICSESNLESLSDHAIPGLKILNTGWESIRYPETGREVVAHEFGHHIYSVLDDAEFSAKMGAMISGVPSKKAEQFSKLRQCLSAKHGDQPGRVDTSDEDFSDWFAAKVSVDLKSRGLAVRNKGCLLLDGGTGEFGSRNGISLKWPQGHNDPHSPSLLRLLELGIEQRKPIPAQCESQLSRVLPREARISCGF